MGLPLYTAVLFYPGDPKAEGNGPHLWRNVNNLERLERNAEKLGFLYINVYKKGPKNNRPFVKRIWIEANFPGKRVNFETV